MNWALVFKKIDDFSVNNSMEENYQKSEGQNIALGVTWGQNNGYALKD